ncbi:MAG: peptide deformylase [Armatimonadota bacterium]
MRELQIITYPDPVLLKRASRVERVTPEIRAFTEEMLHAMREDNGVGLAAPQVGVSLRIIVVEANDKIHTLINPQIIASEGTQTGAEGCLSLPRLYAEVTRAYRVTVTGTNGRGKKITLTGEGLWARAMQHEIDHLDGILFVERAIPDSFHWITSETDDEGNLVTKPTSLEEAKKFFERQARVRA